MDKHEKKQAILEAAEFRHATKQFDPEKTIPEEDFRFILEVGRLSPSSFGFEPWRFVVVQNEKLREKIRNTAWGAYGKLPDASHFVIFLARTRQDTQYDSEYLQDQFTKVKQMPKEQIEKFIGRIKEFQETDFELLEGDRPLYDWASKQTYIALANMMTAAAEIEIDSCPIEGFNRKEMNQLLDEEGLLENGRFSISVMAAFGYRNGEQPPKSRRDYEEVVKWIN
ncbi:NAD(P)H-dependent oxidoreductase [Halobacillus salinarum]|uniref:NAD(P)H-dependent oxidoreductase n=1 Tax=Halobacillus salinarum TaxID=2932257 RepID=A0ABY4EHS2_9BACI|nr:NAD(P)H-dependent oxidoreductase [Halobacillus salinarum]UOQ44018.1 NAD(P)H-dependent oxidoreductase [Halobacillus salinarum]